MLTEPQNTLIAQMGAMMASALALRAPADVEGGVMKPAARDDGVCPLCPSDISPVNGGNPVARPPRASLAQREGEVHTVGVFRG